jgi:hypothetical protein
MKKLAALCLFLILPMATGLSQTPEPAGSAPRANPNPGMDASPGSAPPKVICRPCGEVPPPKGYGCSNGVMVADSVPTSEIAKAAAVCNTSQPPKNTNISGKNLGTRPDCIWNHSSRRR